MSNNTMMDAMTYGMMARDIDVRGAPEIPLATYKFNPTGGVNNPIAKLTVINTPNTNGSMSKYRITGAKIGTKM